MISLLDIAFSTEQGKVVLGNESAVQSKRGSYGCKIVYKYGHNYWIDSAGPCDANPNTINSFRANIGEILGGVLFMEALLQYYDIEPEPN